MCNSLIGFNFGDGHLHNEDLIRAVQSEAAFEPGECVIAWVESEAFGSGVQHYKLIDAALGVIERGTWKVADAVAEQPWLPNGPIPTQVSWSLRRHASRPAKIKTTVTERWHEYRDGGGRRAQRARRRHLPGRRRRGGHRARGRRRGRRWRPQQRGDRPRPAARPLLGDPPDGRRLAVPQPLRPAAVRPDVALAGDRLCPPARRRQRRRAAPLGGADRGRSRPRRIAVAARVRLPGRPVRRTERGHHAAPAAVAAPSADAGPLRCTHRACPRRRSPGCSAPRRAGRCSEVLRPMPSGRCTTR